MTTPTLLQRAFSDSVAFLREARTLPNERDNSFYREMTEQEKISFVAELILQSKSGLDLAPENLGKDFLHKFTIQGPAAALHLLVNKGFPLELKDLKGQTPLHIASQKGPIENIRTLLDGGAKLEARTIEGMTPLHLATIAGRDDVVSLFLELDADVTAVSSEGATILHYAASYGHSSLLEKLLKGDALRSLLNTGDYDGKTPLHHAVWKEPKPAVVHLLLHYGAQADARNKYGYTPLHWAAKHGHLESAHLLLQQGASMMITNDNDDTPLDLALRWGQDNISRLFIDPSVSETTETYTPLDPEDLEGSCYRNFERAFELSDPLNQILYLEKLGDLYFEKSEYTKAASLINTAYAAAVNYLYDGSYLELLIRKLERIEGYVLEELGRKTPAGYVNKLKEDRRELKAIRASAQLKVAQNVPTEQIQEEMTRHFQKFLSHLIKGCVELLGPPPTSYAIMGLGSMSRSEMSPYSDVEFAILIEEESTENLTYFRNLSRLLELKVLNLGETAYPIVRPKRIGTEMTGGKSFTPQGFSMDIGGLCPRGKTGVYELIGTPKKLAMYQTPEWINTNEAEIILANAMTSYCFVMGNKILLNDYDKRVQTFLRTKQTAEGNKYREERAFDILRGHLEEFRPVLDEGRVKLKAFDVKKDFYRPLQMIIGALSLYFGLDSSSTIGHIETLRKKGIFGPVGAAKLQCTLRQVLSWRLKAHLYYQNEREIMFLAEDEHDPKARGLMTFDVDQSKQLLEIYSVLVSLNQVARSFLAGDKMSFFTSEFHDESIGTSSHLQEDNLNFQAALNAYSQTAALQPYNPSALNNLQRIKSTLGQAQEALEYSQEWLAVLKRKYGLHWAREVEIAQCYNAISVSLSDLGRYEEALEYQYKKLRIHVEAFGDSHPSLADSYNNISACLMSLGLPEEGLDYSRKALRIVKMVQGEKHISVAICYSKIGSSMSDLGKYEEALKYNQQALEIYQETLEKQHPDLALCLNNIGSNLNSLARYDEALKYHLQALDIFQIVLGKRHPYVASCLNNIGSCFSNQGRQEETLKYNQQALEIYKEVLGDRHPDVAMSYNNIGSVLGDLGKHEEALEYKKNALEIYLNVLGKLHPKVATCYNNIGASLRYLKRYPEALENMQNALEIYKELQDELHPDIAAIYNNIGAILSNLGRNEESLQYKQKALENFKVVFGERHPNVATVYNEIGVSLSGLGRYEEALKYIQNALSIQEEVLGLSHPLVALGYNNIGGILSDLGKHEEAVTFLKIALKLRKKTMGKRHPTVGISYKNIGTTFRDLQNYQEALKYQKKGLDIDEEILGEWHPDLVMSYNNLGGSLSNLGRHEESLQCHLKVLEIRKRTLGESHPDLLLSYGWIVHCLEALGRKEDLLVYYQKTLWLRLKIYGEQHADTAQSFAYIGFTLNQLSRYQEGLENTQKGLQIRKVLFGEQHSSIGRSYKQIAVSLRGLGKEREALEYEQKAAQLLGEPG